ncbi:MAG: TVP38/TMEM64 family protein [Alphaproteobacteria bacterium]
MKLSLRRLVPLLLLAAATVLVFATGLDRYLSMEVLSEHYLDLRAWAAAHPVAAPLAFGAAYAAGVAVSIPGAAIMTVAGGLMFGLVLGTLIVVVSATFGATIVFLIAKTALGEPLRRRASGWIKRMEQGFQADALSYLLVLRLVPIFPFWLVNIVPAFLGMRLASYVLATFFGILPGTAVIASIGNGLGEILEAGERPDLSIVFSLEVLGPLVALAVLVLSTSLYRRWRRGRDAS